MTRRLTPCDQTYHHRFSLHAANAAGESVEVSANRRLDVGIARSVRGLLAVAAILVSICSGSSVACAPTGCGINPRLEIVPMCPANGEELTVIAAGDWTDSCIPKQIEIERSGTLLAVRAIRDYSPGSGCLTVITPWRLSQTVDRLPPGTYAVELYVLNRGEPSPKEPCAKQSFAVAAGGHTIFLPLIASRAVEP
jgi:hypothetical protein